ncbi:CobB2: cobyrinic acid a,c-diamide synthase [Desulfosarcina variabilis str. Montpellier]
MGLMAALKARGLSVAPFKVGPDFIDPGHHGRVTGQVSRNLDGWMLSKAYNQSVFARHAKGFDVAVVEGVMGLFDGYEGRSEAGSTAQMAKWLGLPVVLVVGARSMARSAAALVQGYERFDDALSFAGVLFNHVGSPRHLAYLKEAAHGHVRMPVLGGLRRDMDVAIPERHLGLMTSEDHDLSADHCRRLADMIESAVDLDFLLAQLPDAFPDDEPVTPAPGSDDSVRIGVARDAAFCFYYADNLELLEAAGATLVYFSPLTDARLPDDLAGLYFGGGYPELHATALADNCSLRQEVRARSRMKMPIYGECGGFMYLCREMGDIKGHVFPMTGCLPFATRMLDRRKALGYREVTQTRATPLGPIGQTMRGHEFHYSTIVEGNDNATTVYRLTDRMGLEKAHEGFLNHQTLGSYVHLHLGSCPQAAHAFVAACRQWAEK